MRNNSSRLIVPPGMGMYETDELIRALKIQRIKRLAQARCPRGLVVERDGTVIRSNTFSGELR